MNRAIGPRQSRTSRAASTKAAIINKAKGTQLPPSPRALHPPRSVLALMFSSLAIPQKKAEGSLDSARASAARMENLSYRKMSPVDLPRNPLGPA